jgi:HEAT repeat protein
VLADASADAAREVRVAVAAGLGTIGDPRATGAVATLSLDQDPLVRAAALTAAADLGTGGDLARLAESGLADPAWQVRRGAATALGALDVPSPSLLDAVTDDHPNVRRAAVQALGKWARDPEVAARLRTRRTDSDADVRAYTRMALGS